MKHDLTKDYTGADLSGAVNGVVYLAIVRDETLEQLSVRTDAAQSGAAVFEVRKNNVVITGLSALTIPNGAKVGTASGLSVALADGDEIVLNLLSGNVSSPITLNLAVEDGQSSGGGHSFYDPDKPNASPSSFDDDFTGTALAGAWSVFGASELNLTVGDHLLQLAQASQSDYKLSGIYKAVPSGSFSLVARVLPNFAPGTDSAKFLGCGFALLEDGANTATKKLATSGFQMNGTTYKYGQIERWATRSDYTTNLNGGATIDSRDFRHWRYLRLDYDGANYKLFWSRNGFDWGDGVTFAPGFTPAHVGFYFYNYGNPGAAVFYVDWVRKYATLPPFLGGGR